MPPVGDAAWVASQLSRAVMLKDESAYDALFSGQTNAGSREWTWQNMIALKDVSFGVSDDDTLVAYWRAPNDVASASQHIGRISCPAANECALTDIGPQVAWPAPIWAVQPIDILVEGQVTVLAPAGSTTASDWLSAAESAGVAVASAGLPSVLRGWNGALVVELPKDSAALAHVLGVATVADFTTTGAITWTENTGYSPSPGDIINQMAAVHIVVNPSTTASLTAAQRVLLLTHEAVHVATSNWVIAPGATWVSEGLAENVAVAADPATAADEANLAKGACTADGLTPPSDDAFKGSDAASLMQAYATAQVLIGLVRANLGDAASDALLSLLVGQPVLGNDASSVDLPAWSKQWCES